MEETLGGFVSDVISTEGRVGDPVETVIEATERLGARYLVIGEQRRSPAGKAIFGNKT